MRLDVRIGDAEFHGETDEGSVDGTQWASWIERDNLNQRAYLSALFDAFLLTVDTRGVGDPGEPETVEPNAGPRPVEAVAS